MSASELHLVINPVPAYHNLVTWVHQLEFGEKSSAPGTDTTRGLSCRSGGEATAASLSLDLITPLDLPRVSMAKLDSRIMQAIFNGTVIAESDDLVMVDGNPYFPREAMKTEFFRESSLTTVCGWKGTARYWDVVVGVSEVSNVVWAYDTPKPDAEKIRERFAFYRNKGVTLV